MHWEVFTELSRLPTQIHWLLAVGAFVIGLIILARQKGTRSHVALGRLWVGIMIIVSLSAIFIGSNSPDNPISIGFGFSYIHLLIPFTLVCLFLGIRHIRRGNMQAHKRFMTMTFFGSLVIAGAFTFLPGRHMHTLFFGEQEDVTQRIEAGYKK